MRAKAKSRRKGRADAVRGSGPGKSLHVRPVRNDSLQDLKLPETYGETRVVLICIDPHLAHVYWEVRPADLRKVKRRLHRQGGTLISVLRFYDVTFPADSESEKPFTFDVTVDLSAGNWYVPLWSPDKEYFVELGLMNTQGDFRFLARSNRDVVPPAEPSEVRSISYMQVAPADAQSRDDVTPSFTMYELRETASPPSEAIGPFSHEENLPLDVLSKAHSEVQIIPPDIPVPVRHDDITVQVERDFRIGSATSPQPKGF